MSLSFISGPITHHETFQRRHVATSLRQETRSLERPHHTDMRVPLVALVALPREKRGVAIFAVLGPCLP